MRLYRDTSLVCRQAQLGVSTSPRDLLARKRQPRTSFASTLAIFLSFRWTASIWPPTPHTTSHTGPNKVNAESRKLNFELYVLSEVLKLPSLHYGFWDTGTASDCLDLDELRCAQGRFRDELLSAIPEGVTNVLDVGAGIGDSAFEMVRRGYNVVAISPDRNHEKYFVGCSSPRLCFRCSTLEKFQTDSRFDLLYFSESINYIDREFGLRQSCRLTKPGGHLLVSGTFRSPGKQPYPEGFDLAELEYVKQAEASGFELVEARDITENVLPTVRLARRAITDYLPPLREMGKAFLETRTPVSRALLKWALARSRRSFDKAVANYYCETDPEYFVRCMRYATLLLRVVA